MTASPYNRLMTFVVRVTVDEAGRMSGIVERVRTGEKERFEGVEAIGSLILRWSQFTAEQTSKGDYFDENHKE